MRHKKAAFLALLLAVPLALSAIARLSATPFDSWEPHCYLDEGSQAKICTTELRAMADDREFVFYFARGPSGPVPLIAQADGLDLLDMTVTVDEEAPVVADRCEAALCVFESKKSRHLVRTFKKGRSVHVVIHGRDNRILFDQAITLVGFSAAYSRYR